MPFKHLFIFPTHRLSRHFFGRLHEKMTYSVGSRVTEMKHSFQRLRMMTYEGEHEITVVSVEEIERGWSRMRGMQFDKISLHETVELTESVHEFLQIQIHVRYRGIRIHQDPSLRNNEMYFVNDSWIKERMEEQENHRMDAMRYLMGNWDVKVPEFKGVLGDVSV